MFRSLRSMFLPVAGVLLLTGCSSFLTNIASSSTPSAAPLPVAAENFDEATLPTVTKEEYVEALTAAYTAFLSKQGDDAIIISGTPVGGNYGEGITVSGVVNPDGTYQTSTSSTINGTTNTITSICPSLENCYVSTDNGESWLQGVGSGNDWSPQNRTDTSLLLFEGNDEGVTYRMDAAEGVYSAEAETGFPLQNTIFRPDSITEYKTVMAENSTEVSTTVKTTSFGIPVSVEIPENILPPAQ